MCLTWARLAVDAIRHSLIARHDVVLQDHVCPLVDLSNKTTNQRSWRWLELVKHHVLGEQSL